MVSTSYKYVCNMYMYVLYAPYVCGLIIIIVISLGITLVDLDVI